MLRDRDGVMHARHVERYGLLSPLRLHLLFRPESSSFALDVLCLPPDDEVVPLVVRLDDHSWQLIKLAQSTKNLLAHVYGGFASICSVLYWCRRRIRVSLRPVLGDEARRIAAGQPVHRSIQLPMQRLQALVSPRSIQPGDGRSPFDLCDERDWEHAASVAGDEVVLGNNADAVSRPPSTVSHEQFHFCRRNVAAARSTDRGRFGSDIVAFFVLELSERRKALLFGSSSLKSINHLQSSYS